MTRRASVAVGGAPLVLGITAAVLSVALVACDGESHEANDPQAVERASNPLHSSTTSVQTTTSDQAAGTVTSSSIAPTTADTTPAERPEAETTFPPPRLTLEHGGPAWVVVLAGAYEFESPALNQAVEAAAAAGYSTGITDCDEGAPEALGFLDDPDRVWTVSVYLNSDVDAQRALDAFRGRGVDGVVAEIRTFCLD